MFRKRDPRSGIRISPKGDRQLVIKTRAVLSDGVERRLNALVDTGAEACLVKQGLFPAHLTYPAPKPVRFETANGQVLRGGDRCIRCSLLFQCESTELCSPEILEFGVEFYEADIKVDAILSFPWLSEAKLGIFPFSRALILDDSGLNFLSGLNDNKKRRTNVSESLPVTGVYML